MLEEVLIIGGGATMASTWMKDARVEETGSNGGTFGGTHEALYAGASGFGMSKDATTNQKRSEGVQTRCGRLEGRRWFSSSRGVGSVYGRVYGGLSKRVFVGSSNTLRETLKDRVRDVLYAGEVSLSREYNEDMGMYELRGEIRLTVDSDFMGDAVLNEVDVLSEYVRRVVLREMKDVAFRVVVSYDITYVGSTITLTPLLEGYTLLT